MYEILTTKDNNKWEQALKTFPNRHDIYSLSAYCELASHHEKAKPRLFLYRKKDVELIYPFFLREINSLPIAKNLFTEPIYDISTPYGYGGPIYKNSISKTTIDKFRLEFEKYCLENNIVSEFIRFHPLLKNHNPFSNHIEITPVNETVSIDLTLSEEEILKAFHSNHRRNVNKAKKNDLTFEMLAGKQAIPYVKTFKRLYDETMKKNNAKSFYYFPEKYFHQLFSSMNHLCVMALVRKENEIIGAAIFFAYGPFMQYHLGASVKDKLNLGTNPFLFYETSKWGRNKGLKYLHLGGGYKKDDPLFNFKKRFNKNGITPFYIGKKIHNQKLYHLLNRMWELHNKQSINEGFFPQYRQVGENDEKK